MRTNMMTAAIAPVTTNVRIVVPMILPARFLLFMFAIEPAIDENTSGTTTQNIMLMNTCPRASMCPAPVGNSHPKMHPSTMALTMMARNR